MIVIDPKVILLVINQTQAEINALLFLLKIKQPQAFRTICERNLEALDKFVLLSAQSEYGLHSFVYFRISSNPLTG